MEDYILNGRLFSGKQIILIQYLLQKLGFQPDLQSQYVIALVDTARRFRHLRRIGSQQWSELEEKRALIEKNRALKIERNNSEKLGEDHSTESKEEYVPKMETFDGGQTYVPVRYNILDFLFDELGIKKDKKFRAKKLTNSYTTATDLANFQYCPVAFSISNSIEVEDSELALIGTAFHNQSVLTDMKPKLLVSTNNEEWKERTDGLRDNSNDAFFKLIEASKPVYGGHIALDKPRPILNNQLEFAASPDYIFEMGNGEKFIVEEKFRQGDEQSTNGFFPNHKVQLAAYIHLLEEVDAKFGFLVYWYYEYGRSDLKACKVLRIDRSEKGEEYIVALLNKVKHFKANGKIDFQPNTRKPKKCAGCVCNMYCGHKTGRYSNVTMPYSTAYWGTFYAPYPEILKKSPVPSPTSETQPPTPKNSTP